MINFSALCKALRTILSARLPSSVYPGTVRPCDFGEDAENYIPPAVPQEHVQTIDLDRLEDEREKL